jgi:hypothetical protein
MVLSKDDNQRIAMGDDFSSSNGDSDSSNEMETGSNIEDDNKIVEKIAHRETRYVTLLRLGLFLTLLVASAIASSLVYLFISGEERDEFEKTFIDYSIKLTETFQTIADQRLGAIAAFSTTITTLALATNSTWPFVTVPKYEALARQSGQLANVEAFAFAPIVKAEDREQWEKVYVPQEIHTWRAESAAIDALFNPKPEVVSTPGYNLPLGADGQPEYYEGMPDFSNGYSAQIFETKYSPEGTKFFILKGEGPFMPWWQNAPFAYGTGEGITNVDLDTDPTFDNNLIAILSEQKAALGRITTSGYGGTGITPASGFYYPVLKDIANNSTVVGAIGTLIFWLPYFSNILPQNANGFIGVLENTCNQTVLMVQMPRM